jgi:hypothetical protein
MKKFLLLPVFFIPFYNSASAQSALVKDKDITITAGMSSTMIRNPNLSKDKNIVTDDKDGFDVSVMYMKYFIDRLGIGAGIGVSNYGRDYYQKGLFKQENQSDQAGRIYDKWINSDLKYSERLMYLNVPVTGRLLLGNSSISYGFLDIGVINHILMSGNFKETGTVETIAKYPSETGNPDWFGITMNNSDYNATNKVVSEKDTKKYAPYTLSGHLGLGVAVAITHRLYLNVLPYVNVGLTDIMAKKEKNKDYQNVFGERSAYKSSKLYSAGLNAGISLDL